MHPWMMFGPFGPPVDTSCVMLSLREYDRMKEDHQKDEQEKAKLRGFLKDDAQVKVELVTELLTRELIGEYSGKIGGFDVEITSKPGTITIESVGKTKKRVEYTILATQGNGELMIYGVGGQQVPFSNWRSWVPLLQKSLGERFKKTPKRS